MTTPHALVWVGVARRWPRPPAPSDHHLHLRPSSWARVWLREREGEREGERGRRREGGRERERERGEVKEALHWTVKTD